MVSANKILNSVSLAQEECGGGGGPRAAEDSGLILAKGSVDKSLTKQESKPKTCLPAASR